ncbi:hypothetical protein EJB05_26062, partial [Eragrostis curvula]
MEFATGALGTLLPKLGRLLQDEYKLQKSVKKDIEFLTDELDSMRAALHKVGDVPPEQLDEQVNIWERDVRELSYDMEDVVDTFLVQVKGPDPPSRSSSKRLVRKMVNMFTKGRTHHHIAEEIKDIKERVIQVAARRDRQDNLAKAVFNKIKDKFHCTVFVTVSHNHVIEKIFKDILYELDGGKYENIHTKMLDLKQLMDLVKKLLMDKRYLIVIDDMWDITTWKILKCVLSENNTRSRVIITTRIMEVAKHIGGFYELKLLTHENSKILFYKRIFESEDRCPSQFYEVSEKILKKCGGVPLAILTTSSLLPHKLEDINEWHRLCDSIGSGLGGSHDLDNMRKILSLSYYDLPSHLKTCLLYLSLFPEDYWFRRDRLIWRWIAENFIRHRERDQSLFEVGENYFNQLSNRNLIQISKTNVEGMPQSCRVHDMVLDLICSLSKEESFVTTRLGDTSMPSSRCNIRRLSLHSTSWPGNGMPKLRSLGIFGGASIFDSMPSLSSCKLLQVLDLEYCNLKNHLSMKFVGDLIHLRYLGLRHTYYEGKLPEELSKLQFLQTLDLKGARVEKLPTSLVRLRQLVCLCVDSDTMLPSGLGKITSLERLSGAMDSKFILEELRHLTRLKQLNVHVLPNKEGRSDQNPDTALLESLGNLQKIKYLSIWKDRADLEGSVESLGYLRRLIISTAISMPAWINPASVIFLSELHIEINEMRGCEILVLGTLPALCYLYLFFRDLQMKQRFAAKQRFAGAMARLETFEFSIRLLDFMSGDFEDLAMGHLSSLRSVCVHIEPGRIDEEVKSSVEEMLKHEGAVHPNHPSIMIRR